jgi:hypothetical protein
MSTARNRADIAARHRDGDMPDRIKPRAPLAGLRFAAGPACRPPGRIDRAGSGVATFHETIRNLIK